MKTTEQTRRRILRILAGSTAAAALPAAARPATHIIVIDRMRFGPSPTGLRVGDTVVWINRDLFRHTATAQDRSFDIDLAPGASGRTVLRAAGSRPYLCRFHPGMTGRLTVSA